MNAFRLRAMVRLLAGFLLTICGCAWPQSAAAQSEIVEYYGHDAIGSVRVVFDAAGTVVGRGDFLPFGDEHNSSFGLPAERFTGQARDPEAGFDYFNARAYQPRTGRFGRVDPVFAGATGNPQRWNRYAYALNNSLSFLDPSGLDPVTNEYVEVKGVAGRAEPNLTLLSSITYLSGGDYSSGASSVPSHVIEHMASCPECYASNWDEIRRARAGGQATNSEGGEGGQAEAGQAGTGLPPVTAVVGVPVAVAARVVAQVAQTIRSLSPFARLGMLGGAASARAGQQFLTQMQQHRGRVDLLIHFANQQYPGLVHLAPRAHHIYPRFLGGPATGPTIRLHEPYHQLITNEFRRQWPYGGVPPSVEQAERIMIEVYTRYPIF